MIISEEAQMGKKWLWSPCSILLKSEESTIHNSTDWWVPLPLAAASGKFLINPTPGFCTSIVTNFFLELNFTSFQKCVALIERLSESCWWIRPQQKKTGNQKNVMKEAAALCITTLGWQFRCEYTMLLSQKGVQVSVWEALTYRVCKPNLKS